MFIASVMVARAQENSSEIVIILGIYDRTGSTPINVLCSPLHDDNVIKRFRTHIPTYVVYY